MTRNGLAMRFCRKKTIEDTRSGKDTRTLTCCRLQSPTACITPMQDTRAGSTGRLRATDDLTKQRSRRPEVQTGGIQGN